VGAGLGEGAPAAGLVGRLLVVVHRLGLAVGLLVVPGEHQPVDRRRTRLRQGVGHPAVQCPAQRRGLQLVGHLAHQLVAEPQAAGRLIRFEDVARDQCVDRGCEGGVVDVDGGDDPSQQGRIDDRPDGGGGPGDRGGAGRGVEPGHQRFVQRRRNGRERHGHGIVVGGRRLGG
jgi:hypothetical protein